MESNSFGNPTKVRRNDELYISAYIEPFCMDSIEVVSQWTITNCTTNCSSSISLNHPIITTFSEIHIPAKKLEYGIYEVKLTVSSVNIHIVTASAVEYIEIIPTGIMANLVSNGTSMITHDPQQYLTLDPGRFSEDPDEKEFNSTKWNYTYYCRIHGVSVIAGSSVLMNDNDEISSPNCSCFTDQFSSTESRSSVTIMANSLVANRTYQFMVNMTHRANPYLQISGYLLVKVENARSQMIAVGCDLTTMCPRKGEFQYINLSTQLALFSSLMNQTGLLNNITWNIYLGMMNSSSDTQKWSLFTEMNDYRGIWFFGANRSHFTATNQLFLTYRNINFWRFEVVYMSMTEKSSSALHFEINQPPKSGVCSITPSNGTITTKFTVICKDWTDQDGIKDYSFYAWTTHVEQRVILGSTISSVFELRLPVGYGNASLVNVIVQIRDQFNSMTEANLPAVSVIPTRTSIYSLIKAIKISSTMSSTDPLVELLSKNNSVLTGQNIASIFVSPLGSREIPMSPHSWNTSTFNQYIQQLNDDASVREYLMKSMNDLTTTTWNNILLQASSIALLTHAINELTRDTSMLASSKCRDMAFTLKSMARMVSSNDVENIGNHLIQCATNVLSAVNAPLQQRGAILELDLNRSSATANDYDDDMYLNLNLNGIFMKENEPSYERNFYHQKRTANIIAKQVAETLAAIAVAFNVHLTVGQNTTVNTTSVFTSLEKTLVSSLSNKRISPLGSAQIHIPLSSNLTQSDTVSVWSMIQPLAVASVTPGQVNTSLSTMISLSILDSHGKEISIHTDNEQPIEFFIPRDPNLIIPSMALYNVTLIHDAKHQFYFHLINITQSNVNLTVSLHIEMRPRNRSLNYLMIFRLDGQPQLNTLINNIDDWSLLCSSNISDDGIHKYFISNNRTAKHRFVIIGFRELNTTEICSNKSSTPPITDQPFNFSSDYELRTFTSACYYLDSNNNWQSDGLLVSMLFSLSLSTSIYRMQVGSMTDYYQTQCFSTHLSTFASGYSHAPNPVLLFNDLFAHTQNSCPSVYPGEDIVNGMNLSKSNTILKFDHEMLSLMPSHLEHHDATIRYQIHKTNINQDIAIE
ncbi:unnamed protein product [Rotaria socialis]